MKNFEIKETKNRGKGLFATRNFEKGVVILQFEGEHTSYDDAISKFSYEENSNFLQIGEKLYLNLYKHYSVFVNHSCIPNAYVKIAINNAFLISTRDIKTGEEIFFDYSLTCSEPDGTWEMKCDCGNFNCRKIISGFDKLSDIQKKKYIETNVVSKYILKNEQK